jgi:hypothetical protein
MNSKESEASLLLKAAKWALLFSPIAQIGYFYIDQYLKYGSFQCHWDPMHGSASPCNPVSLFFSILFALPFINLFTLFTPTLISYPICWFVIYIYCSLKRVRDQSLKSRSALKDRT